MKKSRFISLSIISTIFMGCGDQTPSDIYTYQNYYDSQEECASLWGDDCEYDDDIDIDLHGKKKKGAFHGPHYFSSGGKTFFMQKNSSTPVEWTKGSTIPGKQMLTTHKMPASSGSIKRGGFGGLSFFHSSSGS